MKSTQKRGTRPGGPVLGSSKKRSGTMLRVIEPVVSSLEPLVEWGASLPSTERLPAQVLPGPTEASRNSLLERYLDRGYDGADVSALVSTTWTVEGVVESLTRVTRELRVQEACQEAVFRVKPVWGEPWEVIRALLSVERVVLDEPFRSMVDEGGHPISDLFRTLMEGRFLVRECASGHVVEEFVTSITRWMTGAALDDADRQTLQGLKIDYEIISSDDKMNLLCFVLLMASQNDLLRRLMISFDGLEYVTDKKHFKLLDELYVLLKTVRHWTRKGRFPLGVLIGWDATLSSRTVIRKVHPKLHQMLEEGLEWANP